MPNVELSPEFLLELKNVDVVGKKKKSLEASKENALRASALESRSGFWSEALTTRYSPQLPVSKRKTEELPSSDCPSEPSSRQHAPGHLYNDGPAAQGTTDETEAQSSQQLESAVGWLVNAPVVAGLSGLRQPSWQHKLPVKVSGHSEATVLSEAVTRLVSLGDIFGPLCGIPGDTTLRAQVATNSFAPSEMDKIRTPSTSQG